MNKPFYYSKTLWINIIALIALILQLQYGYIIGLEVQATILVLINLILRAITNENIVWSE